MSNTIGHNGTTGWVMSPRTDERCAKRTERREAVAAAWVEAADVEAADVAPAFAGTSARRRPSR